MAIKNGTFTVFASKLDLPLEDYFVRMPLENNNYQKNIKKYSKQCANLCQNSLNLPCKLSKDPFSKSIPGW